MGFFCSALEKNFSDVSIDVLVRNHNGIPVQDHIPDIGELNRRFDLDLQRTRVITEFNRDSRTGDARSTGENKIGNARSTGKSETAIGSVQGNRQTGFLSKILNYHRIRHFTGQYDMFVNWDFDSRQTGMAKCNIYCCMFPPRPYRMSAGLSGNGRSESSSVKRLIISFAKNFEDSRFEKADYRYYLCDSEFSREWLLRYWRIRNPEGAVILYPPACSEADTAPDVGKEAEGNASPFVSGRKKQILSVGRFFAIGHSKKQIEMIEAFLDHEEELADCTYHLAGSVSDRPEDREYLRRAQELADRSDRVFLHINCSYDELQELYRESSFFWHATGYGVDAEAHPEEMEHFGITTVEAMAHGVIPIVINRGGQRELVDQGTDGYLWDSLDECVERTASLLGDSGRISEMSRKAVEKARQFSIDRFYDNCSQLFSVYI